MKHQIQTHTPLLALLLLATLFTSQPALAYYDPGVQRWLNRDSLGEHGFEMRRGDPPDAVGDGPHLFAFVRNNPMSVTDPVGLAIYKCSRNTEWKNDGGLQHTYLWDDRFGTQGPRSCGRDGAGYPILGPARGVSNPLDKGPGVDKCVKVPNSGGKEDAVMACCRKPRYKPFPFSDCHDWVENCLEENGLEDPYIYGRYKGPIDRWWEKNIPPLFRTD